MAKKRGGRRNRAFFAVKELTSPRDGIACLQQKAAAPPLDEARKIGYDEKAAQAWWNLLAFLAKLGLAVLDVFEPVSSARATFGQRADDRASSQAP